MTAEILEKIGKRLHDLETFSGKNQEFLKLHRHLDEGTPERAYWHAGYASALRDLLNLISGTRKSN